MATYRFTRLSSIAYELEIEADSFEEAANEANKTPVDMWDTDNETFLSESHAAKLDDDGYVIEEIEWSPEDY